MTSEDFSIEPETEQKLREALVVLEPLFGEAAKNGLGSKLIPGGDGSAQVEWHSLGWDIELWIEKASLNEQSEGG